jgi:hypothetical protein
VTLVALGVAAVIWYIWPYSEARKKGAIVQVTNRMYYTVQQDDSTLLYFAGFDSLGIERLSLEASAATQTIRCGGFILNRGGDIITSERIMPATFASTDRAAVDTALLKEKKRLTKRIDVLKKQYRGRDNYLDTHIEEDNGYAQMVLFYKSIKTELDQRRKELQILDRLTAHRNYTVTCSSNVTVAFTDSSYHIGKSTANAKVTATGNGIALVHLNADALPDGHSFLVLSWWDEGTGKSKRDVFRLSCLGYYSNINQGKKPWQPEVKSYEGIQLGEKWQYVITEMGLLNKMDGFPLVNRWGRVVAVVVSQNDATSIQVKGLNSKSVRQWLNSLGHAGGRP